MFSTSIEEHDETYTVKVPSSEVDYEALSADETYRVAVLGLLPRQRSINVCDGAGYLRSGNRLTGRDSQTFRQVHIPQTGGANPLPAIQGFAGLLRELRRHSRHQPRF